MPKKCTNCGGSIGKDEDIVHCWKCKRPYHEDCKPMHCLKCKTVL